METIPGTLTEEQIAWKAQGIAYLEQGDLEAFFAMPTPPFPVPTWAEKNDPQSGHQGGRQKLIYIDSTTQNDIEVSLVVIPNSLLDKTIDFDDWRLYWKEPYPGARREVMRANGALHVERGVRTNVTRKTFLIWRQENPRFFITARELGFWMRKGVFRLALSSRS
jgi:hypothetical protein